MLVDIHDRSLINQLIYLSCLLLGSLSLVELVANHKERENLCLFGSFVVSFGFVVSFCLAVAIVFVFAVLSYFLFMLLVCFTVTVNLFLINYSETVTVV